MSYELVLLLMDANRTRKVEAEIRERVQTGKCVCGCGKLAGDNPKLGLCRTCYYRYRESFRGLTKRQAAELQSKLVREGLVLQSHEIRKIKQESVFDKAAKAVS